MGFYSHPDTSLHVFSLFFYTNSKIELHINAGVFCLPLSLFISINMEISRCLIATISVSSYAFFLHLTPFLVYWFHYRYMFINLQKKSPIYPRSNQGRRWLTYCYLISLKAWLISTILLRLRMLLNHLLIDLRCSCVSIC